MATFEVFDELMEITGSTELHKRMRFWFVQEIAKEEGLLKFLRDRCDDLRRKNARRRVLIREMEGSGEHGGGYDAERYTRTYEAYEQFQAMTNQEAEGSGSGIKRTRTYISRDQEEVEQRLLVDYFGNIDTPPKYPEENFRRRYRMSSTLFAKIVNDITSYNQCSKRRAMAAPKASLRREVCPPRYEMDQGVDSRRGVR
ncbi:hypothetical protein Tco_0157208 [Tanacetum coccineum]